MTEVTTMQRYECQDVQAVLSGILDGELDAETSHLAEAHLSQCAPCRAVLQQAEETDDLLRATIGTYEVWPADLEKRIRAEVFGEPETEQSTQRRRRLLFAAWSGWSIAAIVMLGFGLSFSQGWRHSSTGAGDAVAHSDEVSPALTPVRKTWIPPVGSELVSRSIFDEDLGLGQPQTQPPELAVNEQVNPELPSESLAMASEPTLESTPQPIEAAQPRRSSFTDRAIAGVESEIQAARWLQFIAANLPARSPETLDVTPKALPNEPKPTPTVAVAMNTQPADFSTGEVLHQASILLTVLEQAGEGSFSDVRMVQQALSSDDVLERLAVAREDLQSPDSIDLVNRAWSMLEWTNGSVDQEELERVKRSIALQDLPRRLERLSDQYWN